MSSLYSHFDNSHFFFLKKLVYYKKNRRLFYWSFGKALSLDVTMSQSATESRRQNWRWLSAMMTKMMEIKIIISPRNVFVFRSKNSLWNDRIEQIRGCFPMKYDSIIKDSRPELPQTDYSAPLDFCQALACVPHTAGCQQHACRVLKAQSMLNEPSPRWKPHLFPKLDPNNTLFLQTSVLAESLPKIHFMEFPFKVPSKRRNSSLWKTKWKIFFHWPLKCLNFQNKYLLLE